MVRSMGYVVLPVLVVAAAAARPAPAHNPAGVLRLGMLQGMFKDVPEVVVKATAQPFAELFQKQTGLKGDVIVVPDFDALATQMKDSRLDVGVFHGFEFAWVRDHHPELEPVAIAIPPRRKVQACLVVHKDSAAEGPKDLQGPSVAVPLFTNAPTRLYLERIRDGLPSGCCESAKGERLTPEELLDKVAQNQVACALMDVSSLTAYQTNKPGAFKNLRVLCESDPFPSAVIALRKGALSPAAGKAIRNGLANAKNTAQGRAFLMLWQLQGFEDVPADFDAEMKRSLKAFPPPAKAAEADKNAQPK